MYMGVCRQVNLYQTKWKERTDSQKLSCDLHTLAAYISTHTHTPHQHHRLQFKKKEKECNRFFLEKTGIFDLEDCKRSKTQGGLKAPHPNILPSDTFYMKIWLSAFSWEPGNAVTAPGIQLWCWFGSEPVPECSCLECLFPAGGTSWWGWGGFRRQGLGWWKENTRGHSQRVLPSPYCLSISHSVSVYVCTCVYLSISYCGSLFSFLSFPSSKAPPLPFLLISPLSLPQILHILLLPWSELRHHTFSVTVDGTLWKHEPK